MTPASDRDMADIYQSLVTGPGSSGRDGGEASTVGIRKYSQNVIPIFAPCFSEKPNSIWDLNRRLTIHISQSDSIYVRHF